MGALPIVGMANLAMGIELDECATLPTMVQKEAGGSALGLQPTTTAQASAAATQHPVQSRRPLRPQPRRPRR